MRIRLSRERVIICHFRNVSLWLTGVQILGQFFVCLLAKENLTGFFQSRRVNKILVTYHQRNLRAAAQKIFQFGDHFTARCKFDLATQVFGIFNQ